MPLLISGAIVSPVDRRSYHALTRAFLYVGEDGVIKAIKRISPAAAAGDVDAFLAEVGHCGELERLDLARGEFVIPGFIDTHTVRLLCHCNCPAWLSPRVTPEHTISCEITTACTAIPQYRGRSRAQTLRLARKCHLPDGSQVQGRGVRREGIYQSREAFHRCWGTRQSPISSYLSVFSRSLVAPLAISGT